MKVVFVLPRIDCNDGVASHVELLSSELVRRGFELALVTGLVTGQTLAAGRYRTLRRNFPTWEEIHPQQLKARTAVFMKLAGALNRIGAEVIHAHGLSLLSMLRVLALARATPIVATYHPSSHGKTAGDFKFSFSSRHRLAAAGRFGVTAPDPDGYDRLCGELARRTQYCAWKRVMDVAVGAGLLLLMLPVLLIVAGLIRMGSDGPVLYRTPRHGRNGREFMMLKFRTMRRATPAEDVAFRALVAETGVLPKSAADARITPLGRFLRRTSIDETPQFINVLRGEMSLVGPRPVMPEMLASDPGFRRARSLVRPGLTGLWQVTLRRENTQVQGMRGPDLNYIAGLSFGQDMSILCRTVVVVARGVGAF